MKNLFTTIAAGILLATTTATPSKADLRQQYQESVIQEREQQNFQQQAFENAQFLRGSDPSQVNVEYRIYISPDNTVYEVSTEKIKKIGYTDRVATGCRFACKMTQNMFNEASMSAGGYTDYAQAELKEEWQYFIEDGVLVEYSSTKSQLYNIKGENAQSSGSPNRLVVGLPRTTLQSYRYTTPIRPFHPDNTYETSKAYSGVNEGCMFTIAVYGYRSQKCSEWEQNNPEIGFNQGYEVTGENGWTWCLSANGGFVNVENEGRKYCEGSLTTRVNK